MIITRGKWPIKSAVPRPGLRGPTHFSRLGRRFAAAPRRCSNASPPLLVAAAAPCRSFSPLPRFASALSLSLSLSLSPESLRPPPPVPPPWRSRGSCHQACRSRTVGYGQAGGEASPPYQPSTAAAPPNCRDSGSDAGQISSFRPPGDGPDSLLGAEGCLATAGDGYCRRQRRQETSWRREGRICFATGRCPLKRSKRSFGTFQIFREFFRTFRNLTLSRFCAGIWSRPQELTRTTLKIIFPKRSW